MTPTITCKWPALMVIGRSVTEEQAAEILVRTAMWPLSSNTREVDHLFNTIAGMPVAKFPSPETWVKQRERCTELGVLDLYYLHNSRLTSSWIGGPKGWCNWDGTIGCHNFNIGKWPSVTDVTDEWTLIAEAFPYLDLTAQVLSGETGEEGTVPTAEWQIKDGRVSVSMPTTALCFPQPFDLQAMMLDRFQNPLGEVGATAGQVQLGVRLALQRHNRR
jgi:hypothetical protein